MAEYRPKHRGLERVLGTGALFSTAYGNVGSSIYFARQAFNETVSALTAWGQMLNYIITVAISAFFLPHYLGIIWEPLLTSPGDILAGVGVVIFLGAVNVFGAREATSLNVALAI